MIAICADQRTIRVRASSGYFGGAVPVLPGGISRSTRVPRYPSDMSDAEWQVIEPTLPAPAWKAGRAGARQGTAAAMSSMRSATWSRGIQWRAMPADFPPWQTIYDPLDGWQKRRATEKMHDELRRQCRIAAGAGPSPPPRSSTPSR